MARILKRPEPKQPRQDPELTGVLERIASRSEQIAVVREQERALMAEQRQDMHTAKEKGASLRRIGHAARMAPQTVLNQLEGVAS